MAKRLITREELDERGYRGVRYAHLENLHRWCERFPNPDDGKEIMNNLSNTIMGMMTWTSSPNNELWRDFHSHCNQMFNGEVSPTDYLEQIVPIFNEEFLVDFRDWDKEYEESHSEEFI